MKSQRLVRFTFIFLLVAYFLWELYWYNQVGLSFIKWHTHIAFFVYLFICVYVILRLFHVKKEIIYFIFLLFFGLQITEIILIVTGLNKTRFEKQFGFYHPSNRIQSRNNYYWLDQPGSIKHLKAVDGEFHYTRTINSLGYSDSEWSEKKPDEFRIVCIGDSFTEGDGAPVDSSYVSHLRRGLNTVISPTIRVLNAGKCGSDPFFSFINYRDILAKLKPDLVIQTLSSQDIDQDINERGGFERFKKNYQLSFRKKSKTIEFLYAISYTTRVFLQLYGYDELIQYRNNFRENYTSDKLKIERLFLEYERLTKKNNAELIVVFLPQRDEFEAKRYLDYFQNLKNTLVRQKISSIDLLPFYLSEIIRNKTRVNSYYWEKDAHHNSDGYRLMSQGIFNGIIELIAAKKANSHPENDDKHE